MRPNPAGCFCNVDTNVGTKTPCVDQRDGRTVSAMQELSVRVFRHNLTELAERAKAGESFIVRRRSEPIALLRAAEPEERLNPIGLREMRFGLGRCLRAVERGESWLVHFHGTPELVLTTVPPDATETKESEKELA